MRGGDVSTPSAPGDPQQSLPAVLAGVRLSLGARAVFLIDGGGTLLARDGDTRDVDGAAFAALVGSSMAASASLARFLGETAFTLCFEQGDQGSLRLHLVGQEAILAVLSEREVSPDPLRARVVEAAAAIERLLQDARRRANLTDRFYADRLGEITERDIDDFFTF